MMEVGLEAYRARFANVQTDLTGEVARTLELTKVCWL